MPKVYRLLRRGQPYVDEGQKPSNNDAGSNTSKACRAPHQEQIRTPNDPLTLCLATVELAQAAAFGSYLPARRASLVDPMTALREASEDLSTLDMNVHATQIKMNQAEDSYRQHLRHAHEAGIGTKTAAVSTFTRFYIRSQSEVAGN